jgi:hypothetical protein
MRRTRRKPAPTPNTRRLTVGTPSHSPATALTRRAGTSEMADDRTKLTDLFHRGDHLDGAVELALGRRARPSAEADRRADPRRYGGHANDRHSSSPTPSPARSPKRCSHQTCRTGSQRFVYPPRVVTGMSDMALIVERAAALTEALRHAELAHLMGAGHPVSPEHPDASAKAVAPFIRDLQAVERRPPSRIATDGNDFGHPGL